MNGAPQGPVEAPDDDTSLSSIHSPVASPPTVQARLRRRARLGGKDSEGFNVQSPRADSCKDPQVETKQSMTFSQYPVDEQVPCIATKARSNGSVKADRKEYNLVERWWSEVKQQASSPNGTSGDDSVISEPEAELRLMSLEPPSGSKFGLLPPPSVRRFGKEDTGAFLWGKEATEQSPSAVATPSFHFQESKVVQFPADEPLCNGTPFGDGQESCSPSDESEEEHDGSEKTPVKSNRSEQRSNRPKFRYYVFEAGSNHRSGASTLSPQSFRASYDDNHPTLESDEDDDDDEGKLTFSIRKSVDTKHKTTKTNVKDRLVNEPETSSDTTPEYDINAIYSPSRMEEPSSTKKRPSRAGFQSSRKNKSVNDGHTDIVPKARGILKANDPRSPSRPLQPATSPSSWKPISPRSFMFKRQAGSDPKGHIRSSRDVPLPPQDPPAQQPSTNRIARSTNDKKSKAQAADSHSQDYHNKVHKKVSLSRSPSSYSINIYSTTDDDVERPVYRTETKPSFDSDARSKSSPYKRNYFLRRTKAKETSTGAVKPKRRIRLPRSRFQRGNGSLTEKQKASLSEDEDLAPPLASMVHVLHDGAGVELIVPGFQVHNGSEEKQPERIQVERVAETNQTGMGQAQQTSETKRTGNFSNQSKSPAVFKADIKFPRKKAVPRSSDSETSDSLSFSRTSSSSSIYSSGSSAFSVSYYDGSSTGGETRSTSISVAENIMFEVADMIGSKLSPRAKPKQKQRGISNTTKNDWVSVGNAYREDMDWETIDRVELGEVPASLTL